MSASFPACGLSKQLRRGVASGLIVVEVEPHLIKARVLEVGQGASPEVRGVQHQHRADRLIRHIGGEVGQVVHEAFEDLEQAAVRLVVEGHVFARSDKALEKRVTGFEAVSGWVTYRKVVPALSGRLKSI